MIAFKNQLTNHALGIKINWNYIIIILGIFLNFIYCIYTMTTELKQHLDLRYGEVFNKNIELDKVVVSDIERRNGYEIKVCTQNKEYVINSDEVDKYLWNNDIKLNRDKNMEMKINSLIKNNKEQLVHFLTWQYRISKFYGKEFFNEEKLCLSTDILNKDIVGYHKGTYYDTYLTNQICDKQLKSNKDNSVIASAEWLFPVTYKKNKNIIVFNNITQSIMNNEIGISTLGITSDNYMIIWTQNRSAQSSNGLLVPTGSGSCDWNDRIGDSLNKSIINAMQRELWEESGKYLLGKDYKAIGKTKILGYFRWIIKGGKPEFVGITKLNTNLNSISEEKKEVCMRKEYHLNNIDDLQNIIDDIRAEENLSVPLIMCLNCLEKYNNINREELNEFLFDN